MDYGRLRWAKKCPRHVDRNIVVHDTFFLERLRDSKFSVPPPGGIWLIMTILTQYLSSNLVPPPHRNSSQVPPPDWKKPCIFNHQKLARESIGGIGWLLLKTIQSFSLSLQIDLINWIEGGKTSGEAKQGKDGQAADSIVPEYRRW